jgi:lipopolysaccharide export system permease protein
MAISKGQFNFIGEDIIIKVGDKFGDKDQFLTDVVIHMKDNNRIGNYTVILANEGELISSDDQPLLSLKLKDGNYYSEVYQTDIKKKKREPFARSHFETYTLNIDLSALDDVDFEDKTIDNAYTMLNVVELNDNIKKQSEDITENLQKFGDQFVKKSGFTKLDVVSGVVPKDSIQPNLLDNYERKEKIQILDIAKSSVKGNIVTLDNRRLTFMRKIKTINKYEIAVHEKYVLAFSCIVLFFVGAPLGAIIRKGLMGSSHHSKADIRVKYSWMRERYNQMVEQVTEPKIIENLNNSGDFELASFYKDLKKISPKKYVMKGLSRKK